MPQFQIFRYLKRWRYLIALVILVGSTLFYLYSADKQTYTAHVTIRYTNSSAAEGLRPDGTKIDPTEIYSSNIINRVRQRMGISSSTEGIRSSCSVEPVISDDELVRKEALLKDGQEYVFNPVDYTVYYQASSSSNGNTAKMILSYIIDEYMNAYVEKYVSAASLPNNVSLVAQSDYDYIEKIELFQDSVNRILDNLNEKKNLYPEFRSAKTGYAFKDLYVIYDFIKENCIPYLFGMTLDQALSQDADVLTKLYRERLTSLNLEAGSIKSRLEYIDKIITNFGEKLVAKINESNTVATDNNSGYVANVLGSVYGYHDESKIDTETTYDKLLYERIDYKIKLIDTDADIQYNQNLLNIFSGVTSSNNKDLTASIDGTAQLLDMLYPILNNTCQEFNGYLATQNIQVMSNIRVSEGINMELYLLLSVFVFFVFGCIGTVILGRGEDLLQYVIYNDSKTSLPNRLRCDQEINKYADRILENNFCCSVIRVENLQTLNKDKGFAIGDAALRQVSNALKQITRDMGFLGYNDAGSFLCIFPDCTAVRMEAMTQQLEMIIHSMNEENKDYQIELGVASVQTDADRIFNIRKLVSTAYQRLRNEKVVIQ